jgi:hypothetical protein
MTATSYKCAFQSHNGAIAALFHTRASGSERLLSIPQWCDCCLVTWAEEISGVDNTFNPTMVRLLPTTQPKAMLPQERKHFQSHNGAIAATLKSEHSTTSLSIPQWCDCCCENVLFAVDTLTISFQSHNGAIAAAISAPITKAVSYFQSHNGAIAAMLVLFQWVAVAVCFQSHNGAIAARGRTTDPSRGTDLSIPQWCDCCH